MMTNVLRVLSLLLVALAMSFALAHAAELPGKLRLDRTTYLAVQRMYHPGFPGASRRFFAAGGGTPSGGVPEDWIRLRNRWEGSHVVRAGLAVTGFLSLAIGVATGA